jgi:membrane-anchored mycosin MYCP
MRGPLGRAAVIAATAGTAMILAPQAFAAGPLRADGDPPGLPVPANGCVGASPAGYPGLPWATARMAPYLTWAVSRGDGVTVAIVDSGVSAQAAGLGGAVGSGLDVVAGGPADTDCLGRGTALAGIVAARPRSGTGVVGMAPGAAVLPVRIVDGHNQVTPASVAAGIRAATAAHAGVILVGTGLTVDSPDLAAAVADAVRANIVVVAPIDDKAGAIEGQPPPVWFPAGYPQVLAVGGVGTDGAPTELTPASSSVDIFAPATGAVVAGPTIGDYTVAGSSVAAAYAAGTAALVRARFPALGEADVRARLAATGEWPPGPGGVATIDPYAAVNAIAPQQAHSPVALPRRAVVLPPVPAPDPTVLRAWLVCAAIGALAGFAGTVLWLFRSARRHPRATLP